MTIHGELLMQHRSSYCGSMRIDGGATAVNTENKTKQNENTLKLEGKGKYLESMLEGAPRKEIMLKPH